MFRKLVSNLPFSPALVHDVGFYAKRLRGEEITRRTTVLFVVLALVMQSLAVFSPPESANASSEQDIVRGGVSSLDDFLLHYDRNDEDLKDILGTLDITRDELAGLKTGTIRPSDNSYILTRYGQLSASTSEASLSYSRSAGGTGVRYFSPLGQLSDELHSYSGWIGVSASIGWFAIMKSNGSLITHGLPASISLSSGGHITLSKTISATNLSRSGSNASTISAQPLDKIAYTIKVTNTGSTTVTSPLSVYLVDVLEYASLIDGGGGSFTTAAGTLSWPQVQLAPGTSQERTFVVQLFSEIPSTAVGQSNPASYDCTLTTVFGQRLQIPVTCPPAKAAESIFSQLPTTGIVANVVFAVILLLTVIYFHARTRQLKTEIKIIRHNLNTGIM